VYTFCARGFIVREILNEAISNAEVAFTFDEGSIVWVCFKPTTIVDANACSIARIAAKQFLNIKNPSGRWEGKIDAAGNILESPIKLDLTLESRG
jgi:hypothetical protein